MGGFSWQNVKEIPSKLVETFFSEDDLWYLIVYPQTHASGNPPVRSRFPFWPVNRKDFTRGDHGTLDFEETARGDGKISRYFMGFTGVLYWEDVLLVFFPSKMELNRGFEEVNCCSQPGLQKALEFVRARQLYANFHPTALKDGMGKMRKLIFFWCASSQGWSLNAKRCQVERHWWNFVQGFIPSLLVKDFVQQ